MRSSLSLLMVLICLITIVSGVAQLIAPAFVLSMVGASASASALHFFAIVGMFMALFGGMVLHAIYSAYPNFIAIRWGAMQKLGAFVAVGLGVIQGVFAPLALGVAFFDLFSGLLFLYYLKTLPGHEAA